MEFAVAIERADTGYSAYVPDLPGCVAATDTRIATEALIKEAVQLNVELMREQGEHVPEPTTFTCTVRA